MTGFHTRASAVVAVSILVLSMSFAALLLGSMAHGPGAGVATRTTPYHGSVTLGAPTCNATVASENVAHNAIQTAVNSYESIPGSVVCLGSATFDEQVTITGASNFTLWGSGNTSTLLQPSTVSVNAQDPDLSPALPVFGLIAVNHSFHVTIANIGLDGSLAYSTVSGCDAYFGIFFNDSSGYVTGTTVHGLDQHNGCQSQDAVYVTNGFLTTGIPVAQSVFLGNDTISDYGKNGIACRGSGVYCTVMASTVSTSAKGSGLSATNGIELAWGAQGNITSNQVRGNQYLPFACTDGNYFFAGSVSCNGASLASAAGILTYAAGSAVNISANSLSYNNIGIDVVGGPAQVWANSISSGGDYGILFDFNATMGWLGSPVYATAPYTSEAGNNVIARSNVGFLAYDANVTLVSNDVSSSNVSFEVATDLPVGYQVLLASDTGRANVSGALLGDVSSFQPGDHALPYGEFTVRDSTFTNISVVSSAALSYYGALIEGANATVTGNSFLGFSHGVSIALPTRGTATVTADTAISPAVPSAGSGIYVFAGSAAISMNTVEGYSWTNGAGWWPNSQATGIFAQCFQSCTVTDNSVTDNGIGIAILSYLYGAFPSPLWPFAAPPSSGPIDVADNTVAESTAFGIAFELNQNSGTPTASPSVALTGNTVDNTLTGAVGAMLDQGTYSVTGNTFVGTTSTGDSGASQPTGVGSIGTASVQVLNAYDSITTVAMNANAFVNTTLSVATLNLTGTPGDFANYTFGEPVTFAESGLPALTGWSVSVAGAIATATSAVSFYLDLANGSYVYSDLSTDPSYTPVTPSSNFTVSGSATTIPVAFAQVTYPLYFQESGLPGGTSWSVFVKESPTLTVFQRTSGNTLGFNEANGTYSYRVANVPGWHLTSGPYVATATIAGGPTTVLLHFAPFTSAVTFTESNLPLGTSWSVTIGASTIASTTTTLTFQEPNGSYSYTLADVSGWHLTSGSYTGPISVTGAPVGLAFVFGQVTYGVVYSESTLPSGLTWSVTFNGTTVSTTTDGLTDTLNFGSFPNGTYSYSIADVSGWHQSSVAYTGTATVNDGSLAVTLVYSQVSYGVSFSESNLPGGLSWSVTFNGVPNSLTTDGHTDTLNFGAAANGSYSYSIADISGWHQVSVPYSGTLTVGGSAVSVALSYTNVTYSVSFVESTLPSGESWSITFGGVTHSLTTDGLTDTLSFTDSNGSYSYSIADVSGWHQATLSYSGALAVSGVPLTTTLVYSQVTYALSLSENGLPSGLTWTVTVAGTPMSITTDGLTDSLNFAAEPNGSYAYSITDISGWHQASAPYSGAIVVAGSAGGIALAYSQVTYAVSFSESNLPSGLAWSVSVNSATNSLTTDGLTDGLGFAPEPNGTYAYSITDVSGWHQSSVAYSGVVTVNGGAVSVALVYSQVEYAVSFTEGTLPSGLTWQVTFDAVTNSLTTDGLTDTLSFAAEPNGTYAYSVADISGWHQPSVPYTGTEAVNGGSLTVPLSYFQVTYTVDFTETGLPGGTTWSVTVGLQTMSSTTPTIAFSLPNGTFAYQVGDVSGWHIRPGHGSYTGSVLVNGGPATVSEHFSRVLYSITFTQSGLPPGTSWSVKVGATKVTTTHTSVTFDRANGSYSYTVGNVPGFHLNVGSVYHGSLSVAGAALAVALPFHQVLYGVTFHETGLPPSSVWNVTIGATTISTTAASIVFQLANGTYSFTVVSAGHTATPSSGSFTLHGFGKRENIVFT